MLLKASAISFSLLLLSRLLGLIRESAQAAVLGISGMADVAIMMLTLPDWLTSVLVSGALAYVLLPEWASQTATQQAQTQGRVVRWLLFGGGLVAAVLYLFQDAVVGLLASGLPPALIPQARQGLAWAAVALPAALLSALWYTRLQHERDFVALYAANLVVTSVLILAFWLGSFLEQGKNIVSLLGASLWLSMGLRLLWLHLRLKSRTQPSVSISGVAAQRPLPRAGLWLWAALSAGLPLTLPFVARSFASSAGEGALATFNYAWKLVELPLVLAIQLVATLVFPAITRAMANESSPLAKRSAASDASPTAVQAVRSAFLLAWTAACAATAALQMGAPTIVTMLFGWGRMPAESLEQVSAWGKVGSWSLLPQALIAVALTVLAVQGRMRTAVAAYGAALAGLLVAGRYSAGSGAYLMSTIDAVLSMVAAVVVLNLHLQNDAGKNGVGWLPWKAMSVPSLGLAAFAVAAQQHWAKPAAPLSILAIGYCVFSAICIVAISYAASSELRATLRR